MRFIAGNVGPFRPQRPVEVPLWLVRTPFLPLRARAARLWPIPFSMRRAAGAVRHSHGAGARR